MYGVHVRRRTCTSHMYAVHVRQYKHSSYMYDVHVRRTCTPYICARVNTALLTVVGLGTHRGKNVAQRIQFSAIYDFGDILRDYLRESA